MTTAPQNLEAFHVSNVSDVRDPADELSAASDGSRHKRHMGVVEEPRIIVQTLIAAERHPPARILDFACVLNDVC